MKIMKKLLVPIVAMLAFSTLSTSVSAPVTDYYMAGFYGEASGPCSVWGPQDYVGKGSFHIRGSAIVRATMTYWANRSMDPSTRIWTRRTYMTASWNNKKLTIFMWPSYNATSILSDVNDQFNVLRLNYFGYYTGESMQFISGTVVLYVQIPYIQVALRIGTDSFSFIWRSGEALVFRHRVTVWGPIPWHPSGP